MRKNVADWTCTWGRHMKSPQFKEIKESQNKLELIQQDSVEVKLPI